MRKLIDHYARRWGDIPEFKILQDALERWNIQLWGDKQDFLAQLNVETATWGLDAWEEMLGIASHSGEERERRERIRAKLRRTGTTTVEAVKNIAASFADGGIEVEEYPDQYTFKVIFESRQGIPAKIEDFRAILEEIKPAHLLLQLLFRFLKKDTATLYTGVALLQQDKIHIDGAEAVIPGLNCLVDEDGNTLTDEDGAWLTVM